MRLILGILSSTYTKRSSGHSTGLASSFTPQPRVRITRSPIPHFTRMLHQVHAQHFLSNQTVMEINFLSFHQKTVIEIAKNNKDSTLGRSTEMRVRVLSCPLPLRWVGPFFRPVRFILRQEAKEGPVDTYFNNRLLMTSNTPPRFL